MTADQIKSARYELGLSVTDMARALGYNRRTIQRLEGGMYTVNPRAASMVGALLSAQRESGQ